MTGELFIFVIILAFGSWLLAVVEMIGVHSFSKFFFRLGYPVYKTTLKIENWGRFRRPTEVLKKTEGKFKFSSDGYAYFLSQFLFGKFFRTTTPFPFKAIAKINPNGLIEIKARVPLGTTLFLLCWIVGWTVGTIGIGIGSGNFGVMLVGLIGWGFAALMVGISYPLEKKRMDVMVSELKEIITAHNNGYSP
ncbi:hypothetical protein [uncultured Croceitalea sp.]|uniref:hypothetical protein n=1 Tax=uncultured Croceitalea sp. TaxID=1798908 RepID=UPI003306809C